MTTATDWNLLAKYVQGETSPAEAQRLEAWLREDPAHQALLEKAQQAWTASGDVYQAYTPNTERAWQMIDQKTPPAKTIPLHSSQEGPGQERPSQERPGQERPGQERPGQEGPNQVKPHRRPQRAWLLRIAAVFLLALGLVYLVRFFIPPGGWGLAETRTAAYETQQIQLADGTQVWLNENTTLRYPEDFDGEVREVYLQGEAFFDVARNEAKPFLIEGGRAVTRVLGTSFNVSALPEDTAVVVTVVSGTVALSDREDTAQVVILQKGEQGVYLLAQQQVSKAVQIVPNSLAWRTLRMQFDNQPLSTVGEVLGDAYQKTVIVDAATAPLKLTAQFDNQPLEEVLEVIALTLDVAYRVQGDTIYFREIKK